MSNLPFKLPESEVHWKAVKSYVEESPPQDYRHAPDSALQAFRQIKYAVRIHWGLYSMQHLQQESWPFLQMASEERQAYQQLYQSFNPTGFDAKEWMELFQQVGLKCMAITTKHHEGFSLFDTQTRVRRRVNWTAAGGPQIEDCDLAYSVMETPFKRDIIKELCDAAHARGIKIDFYFSHPDWYDADFRPYCYHPLQTRRALEHPEEYGPSDAYLLDLQKRLKSTGLYPDPTPEETTRMLRRHRQQLFELLTHYGKIDLLCLDMWLGKPVWPELRETVRLLRQLQPEIMLRNRGIGNYADYYTPENFIPGDKENTAMPWMVIYPLGRTFSYDPDGSQYKSAAWIVANLVDSVAKGGNFMLGIGPDGSGRFHPEAVRRLEKAGQWLEVNGDAIFRTHPWVRWKEGDDLRFTLSDDGFSLYAMALKRPEGRLHLKSINPNEGCQVSMPGIAGHLRWLGDPDGGLTITTPQRLLDDTDHSGCGAWVFKISGFTSNGYE
jgi:alpha-L-fucosidase